MRHRPAIDAQDDPAALRRPGDPARIVASGERAARDLGWRMTHDLRAMVASAWAARQARVSASSAAASSRTDSRPA